MSEGKCRPAMVGSCLNRCDLCLTVCPFGEHTLSLSGLCDKLFGAQESTYHDQPLGYYRKAFVGHSLVPGQRASGASGGMATWVLERLLTSGKVDRVLAVAAQTGPGVPLFRYEACTSADQVRGASGSKYYPVEISAALREVWQSAEDYRYAVIGLPCTLQAIRRAALRHPRLARRIGFMLGLVCNHCPGAYYTEFLCALAGVSSSDVQKVGYRFKGSTTAIDYQFKALAGGAWSRPVGYLDWPVHTFGRQYFSYNVCSFCDDVFAEAADAVFMDAWLPQYLPETQGTSIVVVRERVLQDLLERGCGERLCELAPIAVDDVVASQQGLVSRKKQSIRWRMAARLQGGEWLPKMRVQAVEPANPAELWQAREELRTVQLSNSLWTQFRRLPAALLPLYCWAVDGMAHSSARPKSTVLKELFVRVLRAAGVYPVWASLKQRVQAWERVSLEPSRPVAAMLLSAYARLSGWVRRLRKAESSHPSLLILPPSSPGSLGDEAVLTALVQQSRAIGIGEIGLVACSDMDDWSYLNTTGAPAVLKELFFYHTWRERVRFINAVGRYNAFYVAGTDVLDGAYSERFSTSRLALASLAHAAGAVSSIVSFSMNAQPSVTVLDAFKHLSPQVRLCARDAMSRKRLADYLGRDVDLTADIAFLLEPDNEGPATRPVLQWIGRERAAGRTIVGFNACREWLTFAPGLTVDRAVQVCADTFAHMHREHPEVSLVLVAHDARGEVSDATLAGGVLAALPEALRSHSIVVPPCRAREVKAICGQLDMALSGRMHFTIACLGQGVPVVSVSYQDKFEGLYEHFLLEGMVTSPQEALLSGGLADFFLPLFRQRERIRQGVAARLPHVRNLARANLRGTKEQCSQ